MSRFSCAFLRRMAAPLFAGLALLAAPSASAATGDFAVVCFNEDGNDDFALITLANIPGGSRWFICDNGWSTSLSNLVQEGASPSPNGQIQMDVGAGGIPFGTVLKFDQSGTNVSMTPGGLATLSMVARFPVVSPSGKLSFGNAGDQLLIYQTTGNAVGGTVSMVYAFNGSVYTTNNPPDVITITNGWQVGTVPQSSGTSATSECNAPAGLIVYNGTNASTATALGLASFPVSGLTGVDNYKYNGPYGLADKTAYLTAINNPANWIANDTVPYDLSTVGPGPGTPEINLLGNNNSIVDGSVTAAAADHTLFGSLPVTTGTITRTFTIQNIGTAALTIPAGAFSVSGANAAEFTVSGITLPQVLTPGGSIPFQVTFDPAAAGTRTAMVNIVNDDSSENPFNFTVQGYAFNYTPPATAPPPQRWVSPVQNTSAGATRAVGSTTNGDIIAATKINTGNAGNIRVTRHLGQTGSVLWTRDIDSGTADDVNDMYVDAATGDCYLAARASISGNLNWFVHRVNGDGSAGWTYTFDGPAALADECFGITRSADGNIVAAGLTGTATGNLARAVKINVSTGASMSVYTSAANFSQFNAVAADTAGNVYATGLINDPANGNGITVKLNSGMALVWSQTFDGSAALFDSFSNVVALPSGDCVVGGTTRTSVSNSDAIVIRYAATSPGTEVWRRSIAGAVAASDTLGNLTVDPAGDIYACGSIANVSASDRDAYVSKIAATGGTIAWTTTRTGTAPELNDRFQNVRAVSGLVYALGTLENASRDLLVSRFNSVNGAEDWTFTFNGSGNGTDEITGRTALTLPGTNSVAIGAETLDVSGNIYGAVLKYAPVVLPTVTANTASVPASAASVSINGTGFDLTPANNTVTFSGAITGTGAVTASTATQLTATLTNPVAGALRAVVANLDGNSGAAVQVATIVPVVTVNTASLASTAATITVNGFGFSPTPASNTVTFNNGAAGTVTAASSTALTVTFTSPPASAASLTAVVTANGVSSGAAVQVATITQIPALTQWRTLHGLPADGSQDYANPSSDGVANLLKYAFNMAPAAGDLAKVNVRTMLPGGTSGLPLIQLNPAGQLVFTWVQRKSSTLPHIVYQPEIATSLSGWVPAALTGVTTTSIDNSWERVTGTTTGVAGRRQARVQICRPVYQNDFSSAPAATLFGNAVWVNQSLRLTEAVNSQIGSAVLDGVAVCQGQTGFDATFTVIMGPGSAPPADGISFAVGDTGTIAWGENGPATARNLTIALDTYENSAGQVNSLGMRIMLNGNVIAYNATNPFTGGASVPVEVHYSAATGVTLVFNGTTIFNNVPIPAFALQAGDRYGFGGRTGGLNELNIVDNVLITPR